MTYTTSSSATVTQLFIAIPDGPRVKGRVKLVEGSPIDPDGAHPGKRHQWHEMLHDGAPGTGFAHCLCGAIGVMYDRPRR